MPLRPEVKHFYTSAAWRAVRRRVLDRAGDHCERCKVPNGARIFRMRAWPGWWWTLYGEAHDPEGVCWAKGRPLVVTGARPVRVVLTIAHLDRIPGHDDEENLRALCQSCHFAYDRVANVRSAHWTRAARKDAARPIQWPATLEVA